MPALLRMKMVTEKTPRMAGAICGEKRLRKTDGGGFGEASVGLTIVEECVCRGLLPHLQQRRHLDRLDRRLVLAEAGPRGRRVGVVPPSAFSRLVGAFDCLGKLLRCGPAHRKRSAERRQPAAARVRVSSGTGLRLLLLHAARCAASHGCWTGQRRRYAQAQPAGWPD